MILVRATGTPTLRAALASPPLAKIQLPKRVRDSTQVKTSGEADPPEDRHRNALDGRQAVGALADHADDRRASHQRPAPNWPEKSGASQSPAASS